MNNILLIVIVLIFVALVVAIGICSRVLKFSSKRAMIFTLVLDGLIILFYIGALIYIIYIQI